MGQTEHQAVLSEPFFQEILNELDEPVTYEALEKQQRKYRAMKNDLFVFYHEGKQNLLKQIREMSRLLEDRRKFRQLVVDNARKDPKIVFEERKQIRIVLDEIDDINAQIDLELEKQTMYDEAIEMERKDIWALEKSVGGVTATEENLLRQNKILEKRIATLKRQYNEKLGQIKSLRDEVLNFEQEHREYIKRARLMQIDLQKIRDEIVPTLKAVKPMLKKRTEFVTKTMNTRIRAERQKQAEIEELENVRRKMDHEAKLSKYIFEKKKPRKLDAHKFVPAKDRSTDPLWEPILHLNYTE